ncbi:MAG: hypothetical protein ACI4E0_08540 [Blautia sp.]
MKNYDPDALSLISQGKTNGVFQLESEGMKNFLKELKPNCFEDIIAGVALLRLPVTTVSSRTRTFPRSGLVSEEKWYFQKYHSGIS